MAHDDLAGAVSSAQCSLCGIVLPVTLMVPDGGQACADIRWYCQDAKTCTERWTGNPPRRTHRAPPAVTPAASREPSPEPGEPRPGEKADPVPAAPRRRAPGGRRR
ncbi:MAG TPA: hypothetical protein VED20_07260 [Streptosporangiaceae bacterium]|nr:hypothetical protein [Streptosporangiaceae bacterium]